MSYNVCTISPCLTYSPPTTCERGYLFDFNTDQHMTDAENCYLCAIFVQSGISNGLQVDDMYCRNIYETTRYVVYFYYDNAYEIFEQIGDHENVFISRTRLQQRAMLIKSLK